ncbi:MAG TPA: MDR family MFS transporter [Kineosporiaceae bacterium]|jgi:EmrB/QacA subfamily drug resistance transporter|nr:MDR family MFS transporter [Kineosporiaceae bacterium]
MSAASPAARPAAAGPGADGTYEHRQIVVILVALMSGMFLAALDQTIVATSIRTIADDLNGLSIQAWATTAYLITSTIATPLYGKLSDLYGRRPFFIASVSIFILGSALSGLAMTMYQLAAYRAFQGIGAGGLFSLALAIIGDIVPPRERARYQGYFLAVFGTSSVLGPVVGGFFAGQERLLGITGWRWVFLVNVPIGLASLALIWKNLHIPHTRRDHRIDYWGAVWLVVALVPLLIVAEQGREWGWTSPRSVVSYVVGVIGIVLFVLAERKIGDDALLPLRLFRGRTFGVGSILNFVVGMGMFGGLAALPLYMQIVKGYSPTAAGLLLLPMVVGIMSGTISSGQFIARTGRYIWFPRVGLIILTVAMVLMHTVGADTSIAVVDVYAFLFGIGLGFNMQTLVLAIQNAVPPQDMGVATSSATFFRQMGGTLGTAIFLSVLFNGLPGKIASAFGAAVRTPQFQAALADPAVRSNPANKPVFDALAAGASGGGSLNSAALDNSSFINELDPRLARPFLLGFADAIDVVFLLGAVVIAVAFAVVWFLPEEKLRTQSGLQAQQAQAGEGARTRSEVPDGAVDAGGAAAMIPGAGSTDTPASSDAPEEEPVGGR